MRVTRLVWPHRIQTLRVGLWGLVLHSLWRKELEHEPLLLKILRATIYFAMGIVETLGGLTGYYIEGVVPWLGEWHVTLQIMVEDWLGIKQDPELSQRIVDPRNRLSALEAIDESMRQAQKKTQPRTASFRRLRCTAWRFTFGLLLIGISRVGNFLGFNTGPMEIGIIARTSWMIDGSTPENN